MAKNDAELELEEETPVGEPEEDELEEEEEEVEELDPETIARRDAALARVRKLGDPVLRAKALPVERFDETLATEIEQMAALMQDALGVGLAATQVGILHRVLVYRVDPDEPVRAVVNPMLEWSGEETEIAEEGCLSIPGMHVEVERPSQVRVSGVDADGGELEIDAEGLEARVLQHEIDHLDGVLMIDRISREQRKEAMRALREGNEGAAKASEPARDATPTQS